MPKYVKDCMLRYPPNELPKEFVQCVFNGARKNSSNIKLAQENTRAFVEKSMERRRGAPIGIDGFRQRAGT